MDVEFHLEHALDVATLNNYNWIVHVTWPNVHHAMLGRNYSQIFVSETNEHLVLGTTY